MFKKKPQIKNLSPIKSSERRKLADQIRKHFSLPEPAQPLQTEGQNDASEVTPSGPTLTHQRNSLLPENTSSAKFSTTHGPESTVVLGTIYVGSHPGHEERVLWFQIGKDETLIPTVYTLWHNPDLIPLHYVGDPVVQKLKGGADLFAPGLLEPDRGFDARAKANSIIAVAGHKSDKVPRWVGRAAVDISTMKAGATGTAAHGLHWQGDELWAWSATGRGGAEPPAESLWPGLESGIEEQTEKLTLDDSDDDEGESTGGVSLNGSPLPPEVSSSGAQYHADSNESEPAEEEYVPTTKEVDDAFFEAFLYSVHEAKRAHPAAPHGFDFPLTPSYLIANMIQPYLRHPTSHYNIKKTSWKNTKKFIKHLDKAVLLKSKDRNGGETVILDIDFNDQQIKSFQPYKIHKPKTATTTTSDDTKAPSSSDTDPSLNQTLNLLTLYRLSSKLVPHLLPSKTTFYTAAQISSAIKSYIEANPNLVDATRKRYIKLDPFLANNVLGSSSEDTAYLSAGAIPRDTLLKRIVQDSHLCLPHHLLLRNTDSFNPTTSEPKPKPGAPPHITVTIERRSGNKVTTSLVGLEAFFINPHLLRPELQKKCAGSASVGQHVGGKPGLMEIQIQGDQRAILEKELGRRGVRPDWIEVVDKTAKKGKK